MDFLIATVFFQLPRALRAGITLIIIGRKIKNNGTDRDITLNRTIFPFQRTSGMDARWIQFK